MDQARLQYLSNQGLVLEGYIREEREGFMGQKRKEERQCTTILEDNMVILSKKSTLRGKPRGEKRILYTDITTIDHDKAGFLRTDGIQIHTQGFVFTIRNKSDSTFLEQFYDKFRQKAHNAKESTNTITNLSQESSADELSKFHDLKEKGIITEAEFEAKKIEIFSGVSVGEEIPNRFNSTSSNLHKLEDNSVNTFKFCPNCGNQLSKENKFCNNCGKSLI